MWRRSSPASRCGCAKPTTRRVSPNGDWLVDCDRAKTVLKHAAEADDIVTAMTIGIRAPPGRFTQPKLRVFIDFLAEHFRGMGPDNWHC